MPKREFLMQLHRYDEDKKIAGCFVSQKKEGMRAFWDGGISRRKWKDQVPYANLARDKKREKATGLWSKLGNIVHAPAWWLDLLPLCICLDGELWNEDLSQGAMQDLISTCRKKVPDEGWKIVRYHVFDRPLAQDVFAKGRVHFYKDDYVELEEYQGERIKPFDFTSFYHQADRARVTLENKVIHLTTQIKLPSVESHAKEELQRQLEIICAAGGEGIVIRRPHSIWTPERSWNILKHKPRHDAEATVVGYVTGKATEKGGTWLGMMGSLIVETDEGIRFKLSGFRREERKLTQRRHGIKISARGWALTNPNTECPKAMLNPLFPRGSIITYKYRSHTRDGVPIEASYYRKK